MSLLLIKNTSFGEIRCPKNPKNFLSSVTKALLGLLPIIALLIFSLKCYFVVKYRRMWAVTSYYKLYPLTMVVLLINLLLHDLPQTILGMIFHNSHDELKCTIPSEILTFVSVVMSGKFS